MALHHARGSRAGYMKSSLKIAPRFKLVNAIPCEVCGIFVDSVAN